MAGLNLAGTPETSLFGTSFRTGGDNSSAVANGYQGRLNSELSNANSRIGGLYNLGTGLVNQYNSLYYPVTKKWIDSAEIPEQAFLDQAVTDVNSQYGSARGQMERGLSRMGINPNSGRYAAASGNWADSLAAARAGAMNRGRLAVKQANFSRLGQVAGAGQGLLSSGASMMNSATGLGLQLGNAYDKQATEAGAYSGMNSSNYGSRLSNLNSLMEQLLNGYGISATKGTGLTASTNSDTSEPYSGWMDGANAAEAAGMQGGDYYDYNGPRYPYHV